MENLEVGEVKSLELGFCEYEDEESVVQTLNQSEIKNKGWKQNKIGMWKTGMNLKGDKRK